MSTTARRGLLQYLVRFFGSQCNFPAGLAKFIWRRETSAVKRKAGLIVKAPGWGWQFMA